MNGPQYTFDNTEYMQYRQYIRRPDQQIFSGMVGGYDIQGSYCLYKGLSVVAYGLNLSNEVFGFYQGSKQYPIQREFYHPTASIGFRWTLAPE